MPAAPSSFPAAAALSITELTPAQRAEWDKFVEKTQEASFFHLSGWQILFDEIFGFRTHYLAARRGDDIVGVLPLVEQNSLLFGRGLIAAPFCTEGGPVGEGAAKAALDTAAIALMHRTNASYIELRSRKASRPGWQVKANQYATFTRPLSADAEANLLAIPRKQRAVVRKALQSGLTTRTAAEPGDFYPIYARSVHKLGTPVFSRRYFQRLCEVFGERADCLIVSEDGAPVSAVMNFYFRDTVLPYYGGGLPSARGNGANDLMYWEVMRRAASNGFRRFDFGRSKAGSGAFAFKKNWGFEPEWLEYEYLLADGASLPDNNAASPKYSLMVNLWKRLPSAVADRLGPLLNRHLN